jgi:hypothetical protein
MRNSNNTFAKEALSQIKIKSSWYFKADRVVKMSKNIVAPICEASPTCSLIPFDIEYLE